MRSGLQAGTTGRGGGLGGEALLNGWGRQEMSSAVAWRNTDARTQVVARTNCQVQNDWEFNQRGRGVWSSVIPYIEMLSLHDNWSIPSISQTAKKRARI